MERDGHISVLDPDKRWIVMVTLGMKHPPTERAFDTLADAADDHDMTVAMRHDPVGVVFTTEATGERAATVLEQVVALAEDVMGFGMALAGEVIDVRVCSPQLYETETPAAKEVHR